MKKQHQADPAAPSQLPKTNNQTDKPLGLGALFLKTALLSLFFAFLMLLITALGLGVWGYSQFREFLRTAEISQEEFGQQVRRGWEAAPLTTDGHKTLLILGIDTLSERGTAPALTDTMMMVSLNLNRGVINTLPLPRDLWNEAYQTKINALYAYGVERYPEKPEQFTTEVLSEMTAIPIHHTLVLSLQQLKDLVDLVGGVELTIEQGFTDPLYPRAGVDVTTETDPTVLYETISFSAGNQQLSGERALQYIRSRHSEDEQGHDLARGQRQQQVIEALLSRVTDYKYLISHPEVAGQLYTFYDTNFSSALPLTELIATAKALLPFRQDLDFQSHQLTTIDDDPNVGVLQNPPRLPAYQYQWVYVAEDSQLFQQTIQTKLFE